MLQLCSFAAGKASISDRNQISDAYCCVRLEKEGVYHFRYGSAWSKELKLIWFGILGSKFEIQNRADFLVTSKVPNAPLASRTAGKDIPLPDMHPLHFTVSLPKQHFYHNQSVFRKYWCCAWPTNILDFTQKQLVKANSFLAIAKSYSKSHPHTAFFLFDPSEVKNIYEEPVTESQFMSRTLVKAFAIAGSRAQQLYGVSFQNLRLGAFNRGILFYT